MMDFVVDGGGDVIGGLSRRALLALSMMMIEAGIVVDEWCLW